MKFKDSSVRGPALGLGSGWLCDVGAVSGRAGQSSSKWPDEQEAS